jgi:hypothetical protein
LIFSRDGGIFLCPVVVYPKDKLTKIAKIIKETNVLKDYDDVDAMFADMGINLDES